MGQFNKYGGDRGGKSYDRGNKSFGGGGRSFGGGGGRSFGGGGGTRQMFPAVCEECGQACEVPFRPTGARPVFCSNCFKAQGGAGSNFEPRDFGGGQGRPERDRNAGGNAGGVSKVQIDMLNAKLDKILYILSASNSKSEPVVKEAKQEKVKEKAVKAEVKKEKAPAKKAKAKKK